MARVRVYTLAKELGLPSKELIKHLDELGVKVKTHSSTVDEATATAVRELLQEEAQKSARAEKSAAAPPEQKPEKPAPAEETAVAEPAAKPKAQKPAAAPPKRPPSARPATPIVTVMGHIDHGKTTLLDAIRKTRITEAEYGGITQHIGASEVHVDHRKIVFIDTPGHAAFTAMRARGAKVTDIVILVVAADDGVMPETREAISHAQAAGVPIIVAINKIDLPAANVDRTKQQLAEEGLTPEEWGGDTIVVPVSALQGTGLQDLLEMVLLVADIQELSPDPEGELDAVVIESHLDQSRGPVASVVVRNGTLKVGDDIVCGTTHGRIRAMHDWLGNRINRAEARTAVELIGLSDVPETGDRIEVVKNRKTARELAASRLEQAHSAASGQSSRMTLEDLFAQVQRGEVQDLNLIIKADTKGSAEALRQALEQIDAEFEEVDMHVIHEAVGPIVETDVNLALASNAIIIGFHVSADAVARQLARDQHVQIRTYNIIYEATEDIRNAMVGLLPPVFEEILLGRAEVRETFRSSRLGTIAGCHVIEGHMARGAQIRIYRNSDVLFEGRLTSLRRFQDDVAEVPSGFDCGIIVEGFQAWEIGDIIEAFEEREVAREG